MRSVAFIIAVTLLAGSAPAKEAFIGEQPVSPFAGTEVSTNVQFNFSRNDTKTFTVEMEQNGGVSNNVQVAFGRDLDGDGDLAPEESDLVLGWRRGSCFIEEVGGEERRFADSAEGSARVSLEMTLKTDGGFHPRRAAFTNELGACFSDLGVPEYLFKTNWNLLKVTRRGVDAADEWCRITSTYRSFAVHIR